MDGWSPPESETLPEELVERVKPELQPGERLLWAANAQSRPPSTDRPPLSALFLAIAFGALSVGSFYAIFGPTRQRLLNLEGLMLATGVISAIIGIVAGIIAIATLIEQWSGGIAADPKVYALTDRRAIIWVPRKGSQAVEVFTITRGTLRSIHRVEYPDGSGDVRFDFPTEEYHFALNGFEGVVDVRRVEDLARRTLLESVTTFPA